MLLPRAWPGTAKQNREEGEISVRALDFQLKVTHGFLGFFFLIHVCYFIFISWNCCWLPGQLVLVPFVPPLAPARAALQSP